MKPDPITIRRALHRIPELGFLEARTSHYLRELMSPVGRITPIGDTGFYVDIGATEPAKTLLLRADMDGLPVEEATGLGYSSVHPGCMHACGHDGHMAALVAAAYDLREIVPESLRLRFLFQPAEEGRGGALFCIEHGVLEGVDAAFGLHLWNELPVGEVALTEGGIMASVVEFSVDVLGRGGHGALPERATNPISAAAAVATALSSLPLGRHYEGVLSVGAIQAGDAFNVIPDRALLRGTARAFNLDTELEIEALIRSSCQDIAVEAGVEIEVTWTRHCKITRNTPSMTEISREAAATTMGVDRILVDYRTMAGEDFGEILDVVGGTYALVGSGKADGSSFPHHSPFFDLEEEAILIARRLHTNVAQAYGEAMVRPPSSES